MIAKIQDGWIVGSLPGPGGREFEVENHPRRDQSWVRLAATKPHLNLHTTEAPDLKDRFRTWPFPPQFGTGDFRIVQLFPIWAQGKATRASDARTMQVEIAGFSKIERSLPARHAYDPLVALAAFLHANGLISSGLNRPANFPIEIDRLPAATTSYYRRRESGFPDRVGVYGHVDLPGDEHWDPGGFDYPRLFADVQEVLGGDEVQELEEAEAGWDAHVAGERLKKNWPPRKKQWWRRRNRVLRDAKDQAMKIMDEAEVEDTEH